MAEITQQTDQYLFECATTSSSPAPNISKGKSMSYVIDLNQGSYTSGIVSIDATNQINGSKGFASLRDSYITVPYVVSVNNGTGALTATPANITQFIGALKTNTSTIIDKVQVELNGKTLITPSGYLSHWNNLRAMTEWSDDDTKTHGASAMMFPDDVSSIGFSTSATTGGDGYVNNSNNVQAALGTSNTGTTEWAFNSGFVKRQLCNPPVVSSNSVAVNPFPWASTHSATVKTLCQNSGKGATVIGSGGASGSVAQIFYLLRIRLVDIHPIFKTLDLVANPQLKLTLYMNTGSSVITTDASKNMNLTSTTMIQGNTCPFMISSAATSCGMANVLAANASTLTLAWGVMGNSLTTTATAGNYFPYSTCRLYIPFYDLQPEKQLQLVKSPKKHCRYLDYFYQVFKGQAGTTSSTTGPLNANFSLQLSGTLKNVKYVALIPYANTSIAGSGGNFATATNIDQFASPFDSAPWTCQPGALITNFNVQIGNQWVFNSGQSYDFSSFLDEFIKLGSIYGSMEHQMSNGLIDEDRWAFGQRILVADVSRLTSKDISQSILVSGTNSCAQGMDLHVIAVYEREFTLDRITGEVDM